MPEIIPLGWFHTIAGAAALIIAYYTIATKKIISFDDKGSKIYIVLTVLTAGSAMFIFQQGGFGPGHILGIITFGSLAVGYVGEKTEIFGRMGKYFSTIGYTTSVLTHMIPAITDGLLRLPPGDPIATSIEDALIKGFYAAFLVIYLITITLQCRYLKSSYKG